MGANVKPVWHGTTAPSTVPESTNEGKIRPFSNWVRLINTNTQPTPSTAPSTAPVDSAYMQAYKQYASQQEFGDQLIQNAVQDQAGGISSISFSTEGKKRLNMAQQLGIQ